MINKNHLAYFSGALLTTTVFLGCGGSSSEVVSAPPTSPSTTNSTIDKKFLDDLFDGRSDSFRPADEYETFLKKVPKVSINETILEKTEKSFKQNQPVNLKLEYKNNNDFYYAVLKSNNICLGENFIINNTDGFKDKRNLIIRLATSTFISTSTSISYGSGNSRFALLLNDVWNSTPENTLISDALKNNSYNTNQNSQYTASFTLQKTNTGDIQLSNVQVSGLTLAQNSFLLRKNQFESSKEHLLRLYPLLTSLFANFEKSNEIFN